MGSTQVSFFSNIKSTKGVPTSLISILFDIRNGKWQDEILAYRNKLDKEGKEAAAQLKKNLPNFTASGVFESRNIGGLRQASNVICLDFDDVANIEETKKLLLKDKYVLSYFTSCSGYNRLAVLVKIKCEKHSDMFELLGEYFFANYGLMIDQSGKDISRTRFISYDPDLYLNEDSLLFDRPIKKKKQPKLSNYIVPQNDFEEIIAQIRNRGIDLVPSYEDWRNIGFALSDKFGESGRDYFHILSQQGAGYDPKICDKQFTNCLRAKGHGITINTFYFAAKNAGVELTSQRTKEIIKYAAGSKTAKRDQTAAAQTFTTLNNIVEPEEIKAVEEVFQQVYESKEAINAETSEIELLESYLSQKYEFKYNALINRVEVNGGELTDKFFNTIYTTTLKEFNPKTPEKLIRSIIESDFAPTYHPIKDFFDSLKNVEFVKGNISKLVQSIDSSTGFAEGEFNGSFAEKYITKWLVSVVAGVYGDPSPLQLILVGEKVGTGKTEFFRRLLPKELADYFLNISDFDMTPDNVILFCQNLLLYDDECAGKSKKDEKTFKRATAMDKAKVRASYGRYAMNMRRIGAFCGSSNDRGLLNDSSANRRIIPISVDKTLDFELYNAVNKVELWAEVAQLYWSGYNYKLLGKDIEELAEHTTDFKVSVPEVDLFLKYFNVPDKDTPEHVVVYLTSTEILATIQTKSLYRGNLSIHRLGAELRNLGVEKKNKRINGGASLARYRVIEI